MWDYFFGKRFSDDYRWCTSKENPHWRAIRSITFALSFGRDCLVPILRAEQADHLTYKRLGRELPWIDLVPLHAGTHAIVTQMRDAGLKWLINPILRFAYGLWLAPWFLIPWMLLHALRVVPVGPIEAIVMTQHATAELSHAIALLSHPFASLQQ